MAAPQRRLKKGEEEESNIPVALIPICTSNTFDGGILVRHSIYASAYEAWKACDGSDATFWASSGLDTPNAYIGAVFDSAKTLTQVIFRTVFYRPIPLILYYSDDGVTFTEVQTWAIPSAEVTYTRDITTPQSAHRHWRIKGWPSNEAHCSVLQFIGY